MLVIATKNAPTTPTSTLSCHIDCVIKYIKMYEFEFAIIDGRQIRPLVSLNGSHFLLLSYCLLCHTLLNI